MVRVRSSTLTCRTTATPSSSPVRMSCLPTSNGTYGLVETSVKPDRPGAHRAMLSFFGAGDAAATGEMAPLPLGSVGVCRSQPVDAAVAAASASVSARVRWYMKSLLDAADDFASSFRGEPSRGADA